MNDLDIALESAEKLRDMVGKLPAHERECVLIQIYRARADINLDMRHSTFTLWEGHTGYNGSLI
jgi:hypothetical protein